MEDQMEIEGTETDLSKACDDLISVKRSLEEAKDDLDRVIQIVISELHKIDKLSIVHRGKVISIKHFEEKESVSVRDA